MVGLQNVPFAGGCCAMSVGSDASSNMLCCAPGAPSILSSNSDLDTQDVLIDKTDSIDCAEPADAIQRLYGSIENFAKSVITDHGLEDTFYVMDVGVLEKLYRAWQAAMPRVEVSVDVRQTA